MENATPLLFYFLQNPSFQYSGLVEMLVVVVGVSVIMVVVAIVVVEVIVVA